jgi:hypothetical protein
MCSLCLRNCKELFGHSWHVSWYMPLLLRGSEVNSFGYRLFFTELVVLKAVLNLVSLNNGEIIILSVPKYVRMAHFCPGLMIWFIFWSSGSSLYFKRLFIISGGYWLLFLISFDCN